MGTASATGKKWIYLQDVQPSVVFVKTIEHLVCCRRRDNTIIFHERMHIFIWTCTWWANASMVNRNIKLRKSLPIIHNFMRLNELDLRKMWDPNNATKSSPTQTDCSLYKVTNFCVHLSNEDFLDSKDKKWIPCLNTYTLRTHDNGYLYSLHQQGFWME